jgi:hypothetical protein
MRNTALLALFLLACSAPASAGSTSKERVMVPPQPAKEAVDAQNNTSREINKLRLRAYLSQFPRPTPPGPAGGAPTVPTP